MKIVCFVLAFVSLMMLNVANAELPNLEIKGTGIGIQDSTNPQLYTSNLRIKMVDSSTISSSSILLRGGELSINAKAVTKEWVFSYHNDGSFHAEGSVKTRENTLYRLVLDGNRIFVTDTGSVWKISAAMEGNGKKFSLQYLASGNDPLPSQSSSLREKVIIPNGNSNQANTGFYSPLNLEVIRETTVVWENQDNIGHTIQSQDGQGNVIPLFNSNVLKTGEIFSYKFTGSGTYHYFCTLHPWRIGTITVS